MDAAYATVHLATPSCPAVRSVGEGERLHCHVPGGTYGPVGYAEDDDLADWKTVLPVTGGRLVRLPGGRCEECPLQEMPSGTFPLSVHVRKDGVRFDVAVPGDGVLKRLLDGLQEKGHSPQLVRARRRSRLHVPPTFLDLESLTERQVAAIRTALEIGYFHPGGEAGIRDLALRMGCSRSTAHEHLRKGLERLVLAAFDEN